MLNTNHYLIIFCTLLTLASSADMRGPPHRPAVFHNPKELRNYLKSLNEYFAIVGRPRFGRKRSQLADYDSVRPMSVPAAFMAMDVDGDGFIDPTELSAFTTTL